MMKPFLTFSSSILRFSCPIVASVFAMWISFPSTVGAEPRGMVPVEPAVLLEVLPKSVEAWTLVESTAGHEYDEWVESEAVRIFTRERPESNPGPPLKATLKITDTGGYAPAMALFQDFAPAAGEGFEKKYLETYPAVIIQYGPEEFAMELLVNERFLVKLTCRNQPRRFAREWLRRIQFQKLERIAKTEVVPLPEMITVTKIDELDDAKSRTYQLATASGARVDVENLADSEESQGIDDEGADQ